ncbi:MAG: helix-turn-helix domain-containing protein [Pseudomonadota bacterium]
MRGNASMTSTAKWAQRYATAAWRLRMTTNEVCKLDRISRATLWRRIRSGALPAPVDRGRQALFCTTEMRTDRPLRRGLSAPASGRGC